MKSVIITLILAASTYAQSYIPYVATTGNVSVSAAYAATLQQPATNALAVKFPDSPVIGASVYCSVACVASVIINATGATTTTGTVNPASPPAPVALVNFFTSSNYSGGTTLAPINIPAGVTYPLDMGGMNLSTGGINDNVTISIASITGTVCITFYPLERH